MKGRILAIDYGKKITGLAWSDPLQISAQPLYAVETPKLLDEIIKLTEQENITTIIIGQAEAQYFNPNRDIEAEKQQFFNKLQKKLRELKREIPIEWQDENLSTKEAKEILKFAKQKKRKDRQHLNVLSAMIILQRYLKNI